MKALLIGVLVLLASVAAALFALPDPGYILLGYGNFSIETSLVVFIIVLLIGYLVLRALTNVWRVPVRIRQWSGQRQVQKLSQRYDAAIIELVSGKLERAERQLGRLVDDTRAPLAACLSAAHAANRLGADDRRDRYLDIALKRFPAGEAAVFLVQAELQLARDQFDQAQTTLARLRSLMPHSRETLRLQMQLYLGQQDWGRLRELLPELRRSETLDNDQWQRLAVRVYRERIRELTAARDIDTLKHGWTQLPPPVRQDHALLALYIEQLVRLGEHDQAESLLREQLGQYWDDRLVYLYGELEGCDSSVQQKMAEKWLVQHAEDAVLLLTLGKISLRNQLWGKARSYLEASIGLQPTAEAYRLLGDLLEQLEDPDAAAECYRKGLSLPAPVLEATTPAVPDKTVLESIEAGRTGMVVAH
ncbi:MAG TPA: heme biosynthesis protein HemY [Gammaproteobacteria bacterium]|nr:heme biosynthesis protein HemY [Gammaproteobacteria bacterium]